MLMSRTLEGSFPNFERVLPHDNRHTLRAPREKLHEAVRRVLLLAQEKAPSARLALSAGQLRVISSTPEVGEAEETLAVTYEGPEMEIVFNGEYLAEWLTRVGTPEIEVALKDADTQGLFVPVGPCGFDYRYVIMPMRL
jgi:DNA polymerase-3 subunit beta